MNETRMGVRLNPSYRPSVLATIALVFGLLLTWLVLFSIGILGSVWRFSDPDAPAPVLSAADQRADLAVLAVQFVVGSVAVATVLLVRKRILTTVLPKRADGAVEAAIAWCAAIAASSVVALALDRIGVARFDLSAPAVVGSPLLALVSALSTGLREEPLLAALPVLLLVGRVPIGWIMLAAGLMRGVLYLYFGGGGFLWAGLWGAAAVWVYYRYRRLWVLVGVHGFVMNVQSFDRVLGFDSASMVLQWVNILVLFGALTVWIVPRALSSVRPGDEHDEREEPVPPVVSS